MVAAINSCKILKFDSSLDHQQMIKFLADEQVKLFAANSKKTTENDGTLPVLHVCWFQLMHMIGNPASIVSFEPRTSRALPSNVLNAMMTTGKQNSHALFTSIVLFN